MGLKVSLIVDVVSFVDYMLMDAPVIILSGSIQSREGVTIRFSSKIVVQVRVC